MQKLIHYLQAGIRGLGNGTLLRTCSAFFRYRRLESAVISRYGLVIQAGPFKGMNYVRIIPNHSLIPKLLGIYEQELHPCLGEIIKRGYDLIANVGSAEGCYAVGLARALPHAKIFAFDTEAREQQLCRELARVNGMADRISIQGHCDPEALQRLIQGRTLVIVDCEGGEMGILDPVRTPRLAEADILVEIHDFDGTTRVSSAIKARFADTHHCEVIHSEPRRPEDHPLIAFLPTADDRRLAVMEREGAQDWFFFRSRVLDSQGAVAAAGNGKSASI